MTRSNNWAFLHLFTMCLFFAGGGCGGEERLDTLQITEGDDTTLDDESFATYNNNPIECTTTISPGTSISKTITNSSTPATICLNPGKFNERVIFAKSNIVLMTTPGATTRAIIDGKGKSFANWEGLVHISGKSNIIIDNIKIQNSKLAGISIRDNATNITVKRCYFLSNSWSAIKAGWSRTSNIKFNNNTISHPPNSDPRGAGYPSQAREDISFSNVKGGEIAHNKIKSNAGGEGIDVKDDSDKISVHHNKIKNALTGIYIDAYSAGVSNIEIYNNEVTRTNTDTPRYGVGMAVGSEHGGLAENIYFHDNYVSFNNVGYQRSTYVAPGHTQHFSNIVFKNNTGTNNNSLKNWMLSGWWQ